MPYCSEGCRLSAELPVSHKGADHVSIDEAPEFMEGLFVDPADIDEALEPGSKTEDAFRTLMMGLDRFRSPEQLMIVQRRLVGHRNRDIAALLGWSEARTLAAFNRALDVWPLLRHVFAGHVWKQVRRRG